MRTKIRHLLPPELDRRRYAAEIREATKRANAGQSYAFILPMAAADGTSTRYLLADEDAHAARERYRRRPRQARSRCDDYDRAFELYQDAPPGGGAA